jgi:hypothetical protein
VKWICSSSRSPASQELLDRVGAAADADVLVPGGLPRLRQGAFDSVGHEGERGAALLVHRLARVVREHEDRAFEGWIVSPPTVGVGVFLPSA